MIFGARPDSIAAITVFLCLGSSALGEEVSGAFEGLPPAEFARTAVAVVPVPFNETRILKLIPDYQTVEDSSLAVAPLTAAQKWRLGIREASDPFNLGNAAMTAAFSQHHNQTPRFGEGWSNYGKRF